MQICKRLIEFPQIAFRTNYFVPFVPKSDLYTIYNNKSSIVLFRKSLTRERPKRKHFKYLNFRNVFDIEPSNTYYILFFCSFSDRQKWQPINYDEETRTEKKIPIQIPYLYIRCIRAIEKFPSNQQRSLRLSCSGKLPTSSCDSLANAMPIFIFYCLFSINRFSGIVTAILTYCF